MRLLFRSSALLIGLFGMTSMATALETSFTGFVNVTGGRVLGSGGPTPGQYPDGTGNSFIYQPNSSNGAVSYNCPCFVSSYEYAGIYEKGQTSFSPESNAGLQAHFQVDPALSATVQLVGRGSENFKADVDWAYVSYDINPQWTIQAGHKRLPIYYYSDYMYVSYAYPWVRPPQDLYGWQIYSYNGVNAQYKNTLGDWGVIGNIWMGEQRDKDNATLGKLYYGSTIDENWRNIIGGYVDFSNDIFDVRLVTMRNTVDRYSTFGGNTDHVTNQVKQSFYGLAFNVDYEGFLLRTEMNYFNRPSVKDNYTSYLLGGGYKYQDVTGVLTWSRFKERYANGPEIHTTRSATVRWDFHRNMALKLQYDDISDQSQFPFTGNAKLLSASWNMVF